MIYLTLVFNNYPMQRKCSVSKDKVIAYIKASKFTNFDDAAKDLMNRKSYPDDSKVIVLKAVANMYKYLSDTYPEKFTMDTKKVEVILNTELQTADLDKLYNEIRKAYFPGAPKSINNLDDLNKVIEDTKDHDDREMLSDQRVILGVIRNMLSRGTASTKLGLKNNILYSLSRFEQVLQDNKNIADKTREIILKAIIPLKDEVKAINPYINIGTTKYGDAFRIFDKDGRLSDHVYMNKEDGEYYSLSNPTQKVDIERLKKAGYAVDPIIYDERLSARFETVDGGRVRVLSNSELVTGLKLGKFSDNAIKLSLLGMTNPNSFIKVVASRVNIKQNQERLQRIQETIPNRNHETFEAYEQQIALKHGNSVAAVSSPIAGVSLRIEVPGTNAVAFINDVSNYVIVNPDNSTEIIDFTNLSQKDRIQSLFKKNGPNNTAQELTDYDVERLGKLQSIFNQFKNMAADLLDKSGSDEIDLPAEMYRDVITLVKTGFTYQGAAVSEESEGALLSSALENPENQKWMVEVDVAKIDEQGDEVSRSKKNVPILLKRIKGEWVFVNGVLGDDELVIYKDGLVPLETYLDEEYKDAKDVSSIVQGFPTHIGYAIILPKNDTNTKHQVVGMNRDYGADPIMNFLKFTYALEELKAKVAKNPADQNRLLKAFNIEQYSFSPSYGWVADLDSYVDKKGEVSFHYKIIPRDNKTLNDDKELKAASRLTFGQKLMEVVINDIEKSVNTESFKNFLAKNYPQFGTVKDLYDSSTNEKGRIYFEVVSKYIENNPTLAKQIEDHYDAFTGSLAKNMDFVKDKFTKAGYPMPKMGLVYTMLENEKSDFSGRWYLKVNDKSIDLNHMNLDQFRLTTGEELSKATNFALASPMGTYLSTVEEKPLPITPAPVVAPPVDTTGLIGLFSGGVGDTFWTSALESLKKGKASEAIFKDAIQLYKDGKIKTIDDLKKYYADKKAGRVPFSEAPVSDIEDKKAERIFSLKMVIGSYEEDVIPGYEEERKNLISQKNLTSNPDLILNLEAKIKEYDDGITSAKESLETAKNELATLEGQSTQTIDITTPTNNNTDHEITDFEDNAFSLASNNENVVAYNNQSYQSEVDWMTKNMPAEFNIRDLQEILDKVKSEGRVLGYYKDMIVYVSKALSGEGSIYHENFHGVYRNILSMEDREFYTSKALDNIGFISKEKVDKFREDRGLFHLSDEYIKKRIAEEYLADAFKKFKLDQKSPKQGWLNKFVRLLDRIFSFFTSKAKEIDDITQLFTRIDNGYYKDATVVKNFVHEGVFELIPSRPVITGTKEDGKPLIRKSHFNSYDQLQLLNRIAFEVSNSPLKGYDKKFEFAVNKLLGEFNVDRLIAENPTADAQKIRDKYTDLYDDIRFALGDTTSKYKNVSGVKAHDAIISDKDRTALGISQTLKAEVKHIIQTIDIRAMLQDDDAALKEDDSDEDKPNGSFEENYSNLNPIDGLSRQFRKFFSLLPYDYTDKDTGIVIRKMVDGGNIFDAVIKISSDVPFENIIEHLSNVIESQKDDGDIESYEKLSTVYQYLDSMLGLNEEFKPTKNFNFYNQFLNTFFITEVPTLIYHPTTHPEYGTRGSVYDATIQRDISREVEKLKLNYINFFRQAPEQKKAIFDGAASVIRQEILASADLKTEFGPLLDRKAVAIQNALAQMGLNFTKTMIKFSLVNMDMANNPLKEFSASSTASKLIKNNPVLSTTGAYLKRDFFSWVVKLGPNVNIFERTDYDQVGLDPEDLEEKDILKVDRSQEQKLQINGINGILRDAARFMIKYNPNAAVSVFQDAQGKNVYRYLKYTPLLLMAQIVKNKGLKGLVNEYPIFEEWFKDNPYYNTSKSKELKLYLDNFKISMLGGARQTIEGVEKEGITFKTMDPRSKQIADLLMFANRNILRSGKTEIVTYDRSHSILEATSTNFLVPGLYQQLYTKEGFKKDDDDNILVLNTMMQVIQQQYNRIQREWSTRDSRKEEGNKTNYSGYNAIKGDDGVINTTDDSLRAYNFNTFSKFFGKTSYQHPDEDTASARRALGDRLIEMAKGNIPFKDVLKKEKYSDDLNNLKELLLGYAVDEFNDYMESLATTGVLKASTDTKGVVSYSTTLVPTSIKVGYGNYSSLEKMQLDQKSFLADYFYNDWMSRVFTSQFFDGDTAVTTESSTKYAHRNRFAVIKGDCLREGFHTVAYLDKIKIWMHKNEIEYGQYDEIEDVPEEYRIEDNWRDEWKQVDVADGQSYTQLEHRIDMYNKQGRLEDDQSEDNENRYTVTSLLQKARLEKLENDEIEFLEKFKVVLGSYKTATGGMIEYHKLSEHILLRTDVSYLNKQGRGYNEVLREVRALYNKADMIKEHLNNGDETILLPEYNATPREALKTIYNQIHEYWMPLPARGTLHYKLNSMEIYGVDQLMDINSSKKGTLLSTELNKNGLTDLSVSSKMVPNKFKVMQLETSGVSTKITNPSQKRQLIDADIDVSAKSTVPKHVIKSVKDYRKALQDHAGLSLSEIKLILDRPDGEVNITPIIATMRRGLEKQGADANMLKFFEIDPVTNKPVYNVNLPQAKSRFQNYFFALYSENVFGGKVHGRKDFEVSSFGYKMVVDENDQVIRQDVVNKDPEKYASYKTRYPGIIKEVDDKGNIKYVVEVIIPKPLFKNKQQEDLFLAKLSEWMSTRIPTEDKRSMVVAKAVDYMDGAYRNSVILPQLVHRLSGSDLDIDALYSQTLATYTDFNDETHIYGDYTTHEGLSTEEAKFLEYLINRSENNVFAGDIDLEYDRIISTPDSVLELPEAMDKLKDYLGLPGLGINKANIRQRIRELNDSRKSYYSTYQTIKERRQLIHEQYKKLRVRNEDILNEAASKIKGEMIAAGETIDENDPQFQEDVLALASQRLWEQRNAGNVTSTPDWNLQKKYGTLLRESVENSKKAFEEMTGGNVTFEEARKEAKKVIIMFEKQLRMIATLNVLAKYKQPVTIDKFKKTSKNYVKEVIENINMQQQINILSSAYVFNNLYKNEQSNVEVFKGLAKSLDDSIDTKVEMYDRDTATYGVNVMNINSNGDDGIGIAATANKVTAFLTKYGIKLAEPIWKFNGQTYKDYSPYAVNGDDIKRVIKTIGESLGMFADAKKEPYPAILNLTKQTAGISSGMIAQGINEKAAYLINKIPLIESSILESDRTTSAVQTVDEYRQRPTLKKILERNIQTEVAKIIKDKNGDLLFAKDKNNKLTNKLRPIEISFDFDETPRKRTSISDLGFTAMYKGTEQDVPENVLQIHLAMNYLSQINLNSDTLALGKLLNLIKKQEPTWKNLDGIVRSYMYLTNRLFTSPNFTNMKEVLEREAKEYIPLIEAVIHMYSTSEKVFLERNPVFKVINEELEKGMWSYGMGDSALANLSSYPVKFLLVNKFKQRTKKQLDEQLASPTPNQEAITILKNRMIMLTADFWMNKETEVTPTMEDEVNYLQKIHPGNAFTNFIKTRSLDGVIFTEALSRMKLDSELTNNIIDGYNLLQRSLDERTRIIADKLYMYVLVKDNLGMSNNSFINYLNPSLYKAVSKDLDQIQSEFNKSLVSKTARKQMTTGEPFKRFFENDKIDLASLLSTIYYKAQSHVGNKPFLHKSKEFIPGALKGVFSGRLARQKSEDLLDMLSKVAPNSIIHNLNEMYELKYEDRLYDVYTPNSTEIDKGEVVLNLESINDPGELGLAELPDEVTRALKVSPAYRYASDGKKTFTGWMFPGTVVNSQGQLLRLDNIDGKPIGAYLIEKLDDRLANTRFNSDYEIAGFNAVYKVSQFEGTSRILNTAFSTEEARDLYDFVENSKKYSMVKTTEDFDKLLTKLYHDYGVSAQSLEMLQRWIKKDFSKFGYVKLGNKGVYSIKFSVPVSPFEPDNQYLIEVRPSGEKGSNIAVKFFSVNNGAHREIYNQELSAVEFHELTKEERKNLRLEEQQKKQSDQAEESICRTLNLTREQAIAQGFLPDTNDDPIMEKAGSASTSQFTFYAKLLDYIKNDVKDKREIVDLNNKMFVINGPLHKALGTSEFINNISNAILERFDQGFKPEEKIEGEIEFPEFIKEIFVKPAGKEKISAGFTEDELKTIYESSASKVKGISFEDYVKRATAAIDEGFKYGLSKNDIANTIKCL